MLDKIARRMTPEEFYAWQEPMDEKYELVDGYAVPRCPDIEMMTGASRRHDQIVFNLHGEIRNQLRGTPCPGFSSDTAVRTPVGRRRPDAGFECGKLDDQSYEAGEVRMVVEVLSPSTRDLDTFGKLDEYKAIDSLDHILLVDRMHHKRSFGHANRIAIGVMSASMGSIRPLTSALSGSR